MDKVVIITGPTAVGKTKCALKIAEIFNTDIINGDAYQVYKYMNIGTAKPTKEELSKIKHHLIDVIDPTSEFNVATYQKMVRKIIDDEIKDNKLPLLVGGSGLYLESIICNYEFNKEDNIDYEEKYQDYSNHELYLHLQSLDYDAAINIHENNRKRVIRLIKKLEENKSLSNHKNEFVYEPLVIFLNDDRDALYDRINSRVDQMIDNGLVEEAKKIYNMNLSKTAKVAIGYKQLFDYFDGLITYDEAINKIKQASRNYAKRQLTWFRNKPFVTFVDINPDNFDETINIVKDKIIKFLK